MKENRGPSFPRALMATTGILATSMPMMLVPLVGPILAVTLIPYLSTALGSRLAHPRDRLPIAITTSVLWSALETMVFLLMMESGAVLTGLRMGSMEWGIIVLVWAINLLFSVLGSIHPWKDPFTHLKR